MGQNNSQIVESRTILVQNWQPQDNQSNVLVNRITHQHIQKHSIKILIKDLPRQTALFASRMSNYQPFICRLFYFHPAVPDSRATQESDKDFREMYLYTDRMLPLKEWSQQKIKSAIQGLKRIVSINGPIKVTENMICENQNGEVKVWMSQNPVNNYPQSKYTRQQQTFADIVAILAKKNIDLAGKLKGCRTLRDIFQKLCKTVRENSSPYQNYIHRASQSGDFHNKIFEKIQRGQPNAAYRNVFRQPLDKKAKDQGFLTPKPSNKTYENYPQSAFSRPQQDYKSKLNLGYVQENLQNSKNKPRFKVIGQEKSGVVSNLSRKVTIQSSLQTQTNFMGQEASNKQTKNSQIDKNKLEENKKSQKLAQNASFTNLQPKYGYHRFETTKFGSTNNLFMPSFASAKNLKSDWKRYQGKNFGNQGDAKQNSFCNSSAVNFGNQEIKRGYDITIINNNVNNFINNITHNHTVKFQKKMPQQYQFLSPKAQDNINQQSQKVQYSSKKQSTNVIAKQKTEFIPVPVFLQKKKNNHNSDETANCKIQANFYPQKRQTKPVSQLQQQQFNQLNKNKKESQTFYLIQKPAEKYENKPKPFNYYPNHSGISNGQQSPTHPKTPNPGSGYGQNFSSFIKGNNSSFEMKSGLRTKTTEFFAKGKEASKKVDNSIQNKSFTQNEKFQTLFDNFRQPKFVQKTYSAKIFEQIIQPKPKLQISSLKVISKDEPVPQEKQSFKKQLRNEFEFLLGGDPPKDAPKAEETQLVKQNSEAVVSKEGKQVQVKDKIIKKQIQFAQLKKQALKVLIDI